MKTTRNEHLGLLVCPEGSHYIEVEVPEDQRFDFRKLREIRLIDQEGNRIAREVGAWTNEIHGAHRYSNETDPLYNRCQIEVLTKDVPTEIFLEDKVNIPLTITKVLPPDPPDPGLVFHTPSEVRAKTASEIYQWCRENGINPRWGLWESTLAAPLYTFEFSFWIQARWTEYQDMVRIQNHGSLKVPCTSKCDCMTRLNDQSAFDDWLCRKMESSNQETK